jgi:hypothetical protein
MKSLKWFLVLIFLIPSIIFSDTVSLYFENDTFEHTDGYYTSGEQISYYNDKDWSLKIAQQIYTPSTKDDSFPDYGDRPYAGWLHFDYGKNIRNEDHSIDTFGIGVGVVGPWSRAELAQTTVHKMFNFSLPQGWKYQIKNEPTLQLSYFKTYSIFINDYIEYRPSAGVNLGNARTDAEIGNTLRLGYNIPGRFDPIIKTSSNLILNKTKTRTLFDTFYIYSFISVNGQAVYRDIFLDGNTFVEDEVTVDKKWNVCDIDIGLSLGFEYFDVTITHVEKSQEFTTQTRDNRYDSIQMSFSW